MSISSIGIQTILPRSGTAQQSPAPDQSNDNGHDDEAAARVQAANAPGTGKMLDRTV
ncbi:MAG: hypothetical protein WCI56_15905 [Hyphomicrobiales bacterium]